MPEAVIVSAVRTPVGRAFKGSLRSTRPDDLAALAIKEALARVPGLDAKEIDDVILGCAMPEGEQGMNVARIAALREGRVDEAKAAAARCATLVGRLDEFVAWYGAETRIMLARASLALGDVAGAREQLADASRVARRTPDVVMFERWFEEAWEQFDRRAETALVGVASLTTAELRVLRFLPTHYSFHEIAERLHVSSNTVKTHVHAVYRKLDASSRSEAVANATHAGLLGW